MSHQVPLLRGVKLNNVERRLNNRKMQEKHLQMIPLDLAGEASDEAASSAGVGATDAGAGIDAVVSLSACEVGGPSDAKGPRDERPCA